MNKFRVMVVDDDPDVRFVVSSLLSLEFETVQATNGLDALEKVDRYEPDLLLMDVMMPVMNGLACCKAIKKHELFEDLPVMFLSASSDPAVRAEAQASGAATFIEKPFQTAELIDTIQGFLQKSGAAPMAKAFSIDEIKHIDETPLEGVEGEDFGSQPSSARQVTAHEAELPSGIEPSTRKRRVFGKQSAPPPAPAPEKHAIPPPSADPNDLLPPPPEIDYGRISKELVRKPLIHLGKDKKEDSSPPAKPVVRPSNYATPSSDTIKGRPLPPPDVKAPTPRVEIPQKPASPAPQPPAAVPSSSKLAAQIAASLSSETVRGRPQPPPAEPAPIAPGASSPQARPPVPPQVPPVKPPATPPAQPATGGTKSPAEILAARRLAALGKSAPAASTKPRALVIIDQQHHLQTFANALKGLAEFLPLEDPVEAIELIARFQPDIVIMGIRERGYSGLQIASMLRENPRLAHIEIIFVQGPFVESSHLTAARHISRNQVLRMPLTEAPIQESIREIVNRSGFRIREKKLAYGVYVKEVIRSAEAERGKENREREKAAFRDNVMSLHKFMAEELKDYREPAGYDELKGPGNKIHNVQP